MKHKHADLIHAWADGAEIQQKEPFDAAQWETVGHPLWYTDCEYRIKPEEKKPVVRWLWSWQCDDRLVLHNFLDDEEAAKVFEGETYFKLEWSRTEFPE